MNIQDYLNEKGELCLRVTPNAPKDAVDGWMVDGDGMRWLKVKVTCVPEDGKANTAVIKFLAKRWKIAPSSLVLVSGHTSRFKRLRYELK
jgi:uncharacterized protein (TIGR00251 family)